MGSGERSRTKPTISTKAISILIAAPSFTSQMLHVLIVLVTDELRNFLGAWSESGKPFDLPGILEGAGIVKRGFNFEMPQIRPPQPCSDPELVGVRHRFSQPCLVIKANRVDHQRVTFPRSNGVPGP